MTRRLRAIGSLLAAFTLAVPLIAQGNQIVELLPTDARHLAGVVTDATGAGISGALVEDCDSTYKRVIASEKTDANGHFSFPNARYGSVHYLSVRCPNFDLTHVKVMIGSLAKRGLRIRLAVGT